MHNPNSIGRPFKKGESYPNMKGKRHTEETRKKLSEIRKGEKSTHWKGGITPLNHLIRNSIEYRLWCEAIFARDAWTCRECKQIGGELHAHHIKPFAKLPDLRFAIDNGLTLCKRCHKKRRVVCLNNTV